MASSLCDERNMLFIDARTLGSVWLLELNTMPGMTDLSLYPDGARAAGLEFPQLVARLIEEALAG